MTTEPKKISAALWAASGFAGMSLGLVSLLADLISAPDSIKKMPGMNGTRLSSNAVAITMGDFMEDMSW